MKKSIILFFIFFIIFSQQSNIYSLDTLSCKYFPLKVGNTFYYKIKMIYPPSDSSLCITKILDTVLLNNKKYFLIKNFIYQGYLHNYKIRYDSSNGNLYRYDSSSSQCEYELKLYRLSIPVGDTIGSYCCNYLFNQGATFTCNGVGKSYLFGDSVSYKQFLSYWSQSYGWDICYTSFSVNFGMSYIYAQAGGISYSWSAIIYLIGANINGIVYGDTTLTFANRINLTVPDKFLLYQNYPNPFNPVTKIKFQIPADGRKQTADVKLIVYDILGKEIKTLVNEQLQPGSYEVTFDGNNLPSGVYFYKLQAGNFIETKKMVLLK